MTYDPTAYSVLGWRSANADPDRDRPDFAAYSPTEETAHDDRDAYRRDRDDLHLWAIIENATGVRTLTFN